MDALTIQKTMRFDLSALGAVRKSKSKKPKRILKGITATITEEMMSETSDILNVAQRYADEISKSALQLEVLKAIPMVEQRSPEWYKLREGLLTASSLADAIGRGKSGRSSRNSCILEKAGLVKKNYGGAKSPALEWGVRYEPVANLVYRLMNGDITIYEFGLIPHPTYSKFGASPDGITELGIMTEFKCPISRTIVHGDVPDGYWLQIQGQLEVCDLEYCDYFEVVLGQTQNPEEFCSDSLNVGQYYGAVVLDNEGKYHYSHDACNLGEKEKNREHIAEWAINFPNGNIMFFWYLKDHNSVRVNRDRESWAKIFEKIEEFWRDVDEARANPEKALATLTSKPYREKLAKEKLAENACDPYALPTQFRNDDDY